MSRPPRDLIRSAALGSIVGELLHDLSNPAMVLVGASRGLRTALAPLGPAGQLALERVALVDEAAQRLGEIIRLTKTLVVESEGDVVERVPLARLISRAVAFRQKRLVRHGSSFSQQHDETLVARFNPGAATLAFIVMLDALFDGAEDAMQRLELGLGVGRAEDRVHLALTATTDLSLMMPPDALSLVASLLVADGGTVWVRDGLGRLSWPADP